MVASLSVARCARRGRVVLAVSCIAGLGAITAVNAAGLQRPTLGFSLGKDPVPASNVIYVAPTGSDATGNGTVGNPYQTLEKAHNHSGLGPGWTIVLRGGNYPRSAAFQPTKSGSQGNPITVMAYPGETAILDYATEFAAFRTPGNHWTEVNSALKLWKSNTGGFAQGRLQGYWEEDGELWHIWGYLTDNGERNHTGSAYEGPMARVESDGYVYLRFQRPSPARTTDQLPSYQPGSVGGVFVVPGSENPNDYTIHLGRRNNRFAMIWSNVSDWTLKDINVASPDFVNQFGGTVSRVTFERGFWAGARYGNFLTGGSRVLNSITWRGLKAAQGRLDYCPYDWLKGGDATGQGDDNAFYSMDGSGNDADFTFEDCVLANFHDLFAGRTPPANLVFRHNWVDDMIDDTFQCYTNSNGVEWAYNVFYQSPLWSVEENGGSSTGWVYMHHNVAWQGRPRLYGVNSLGGPHDMIPTHYSSGASGRIQPMKIYNNTLITGSCAGDYGNGIWLSHVRNEAVNTDASRPHEAFNNLVMTYGDAVRTVRHGLGRHDQTSFCHVLNGVSHEMYDYNHYARVLAYSPAISQMHGPHFDQPNPSKGNSYMFASLAALVASPANVTHVDVHSSEEDHVGVGVGGMQAASPLVDIENFDFRPRSGSALASGAKPLAATGWPGATDDAWRGALDPDGDGSEVGPRVEKMPTHIAFRAPGPITGADIGTEASPAFYDVRGRRIVRASGEAAHAARKLPFGVYVERREQRGGAVARTVLGGE